jgi:hypothetical protein
MSIPSLSIDILHEIYHYCDHFTIINFLAANLKLTKYIHKYNNTITLNNYIFLSNLKFPGYNGNLIKLINTDILQVLNDNSNLLNCILSEDVVLKDLHKYNCNTNNHVDSNNYDDTDDPDNSDDISMNAKSDYIDITIKPVTKSSTRYFKFVNADGIGQGRYSGLNPKQAASKAFTAYLRGLKNNNDNVPNDTQPISLTITESTRGSVHKSFVYTCERVKLDNPVTVEIPYNSNNRTIVYTHKNVVKKEKKVKNFGKISKKNICLFNLACKFSFVNLIKWILMHIDINVNNNSHVKEFIKNFDTDIIILIHSKLNLKNTLKLFNKAIILNIPKIFNLLLSDIENYAINNKKKIRISVSNLMKGININNMFKNNQYDIVDKICEYLTFTDDNDYNTHKLFYTAVYYNRINIVELIIRNAKSYININTKYRVDKNNDYETIIDICDDDSNDDSDNDSNSDNNDSDNDDNKKDDNDSDNDNSFHSEYSSEYSSDEDENDYETITVLTLAIIKGYTDMVKLLLYNGADKNELNKSVLEKIIEEKSDIVKLLN